MNIDATIEAVKSYLHSKIDKDVEYMLNGHSIRWRTYALALPYYKDNYERLLKGNQPRYYQ